MFMLRNTLQSLPINLKLKKLNGSLNIPCRVCFYLCMRTPCHWGRFLCRPIQHSLLSPHHELPFYIFSCEFSEYSSGETDTNTGCIYYSAPSTMRGVSRDFDFADSRNREAQLQWNTIDFKHWFCFGELIQSPWTLELCIEEHICCLPVRSQLPQPALESWDLRKWQQQVVLGSSRKWGGGLPLLPTWVTHCSSTQVTQVTHCSSTQVTHHGSQTEFSFSHKSFPSWVTWPLSSSQKSHHVCLSHYCPSLAAETIFIE